MAGFLSGSVNLRNYPTVGSRAQVDVRRAEIPLLPIEEQRVYGEAFRKLAEFEASLRRVAALGEDLIQGNASGASFHNTGPLDSGTLGKDSENVARDLRSYIGAFSPDAVEVLEKYRTPASPRISGSCPTARLPL
ncbi:hypothetical protein [Streptosporangium sp. CA-115845]|uniref:hypothetical protein n=1 Tax=Streptosporangium sp. CA-115845 TaxID=3240071 RepID=UPI003D8DBBC0